MSFRRLKGRVPEEGTYIAMVFRVAGYTDEVGDTALVQLEHVDRFGRRTQLDLFSDSHVVLDDPEELYDLAQTPVHQE